MFLPCYPLFLVECKSNHPFLGTTITELYQSWKRKRNIPGVAEWKDQSAPNTTWCHARPSLCLLKLMAFPRKCVVTSGVIYPGRGGLGDRSGRHNPNRNKTAHTRAFKIQSLHSSFQTAAASSQATPAWGGRLQIKKYQSRPNSKSECAEMCPPRMGMFKFTYPLGRHREKYLKSIL